jgi:hypothetical protein
MVAGSGWLRGGLLRAGLRGGRACAAPPKPGSETTTEETTTERDDPPSEAVSEAAKPTTKPPSVQQSAASGAKPMSEADNGLDDQSLLNLDWYGIQVDSVPEDSNAMILAAGWAMRHHDVDSHICEMGDTPCASSLSAGAETALQLSVLSSTTHVGGKRPGVHGESSEEEEPPGPRKRCKWKRWSDEEETLLTAAVNKHGTGNWRIVAKVTRPKTLGFCKENSNYTHAHIAWQPSLDIHIQSTLLLAPFLGVNLRGFPNIKTENEAPRTIIFRKWGPRVLLGWCRRDGKRGIVSSLPLLAPWEPWCAYLWHN